MLIFITFLLVGLSSRVATVPQYDAILDQLRKDGAVDAVKNLESSIATSSTSCGHASYDCVPYFQCIDGKINTDGTGLIDVRILPQATCVNNNYPDIPGLCCLIPGADPTPTPIESCPKYQECVDYSLCNSDNTINTDGSGLIDIRTGHISCWLPSGIGGICCTPPPPYADVCPGDSICTLEKECLGRALNSENTFIDYDLTGRWTACSVKSNDGVCCIPPPPKIIDCPANSYCSLEAECLGQGINEFGNNLDRDYPELWSYCALGVDNGICCPTPPLPPVIDACPGESVCVQPTDCVGTALDDAGNFVDYDSKRKWTHCSAYDLGVCCLNPFVPPVLRAASKCGVRNQQINQRIQSNNELNEAAFGEFPWQAIIFYENYTYNCGASLLSEKYVLTAAHCVSGLLAKDLRIRFGEWQINNYNDEYPYIDRSIGAIYVHPKYNPRNVHNDIAILELLEPLHEFKYHINSVCLPKKGHLIDAYTTCYATGWGKDSFKGEFQHKLKRIDLPYIDHDKCQDLLRLTRLGRYFRLDKSFICAGGEENKDACYGDGGGPLVCEDPNTSQYILIGITSWGIGCGEKDVPGVYVDVQRFVDWIDHTVIKHGNDLQAVQQMQAGGSYSG